LTNQPPGIGVAPEVAAGQNGQQTAQPGSSRRHSTSNYELDRTISHTRMGGGNLRRLSIAVVVNDRMVMNEEGQMVVETRSDEELDRLTALVRDAVGYNAQRGDTVNVVSAPFSQADIPMDVEAVPFWEQAWVLDLGKVLGALILGMLLILVVLRPMMRNLTTGKSGTNGVQAADDAAIAALGHDGMAEDQLSLGSDASEGVVKLRGPGAYEQNIDMVRNVVKEDPKLVAQVMRNWISADK
jgi:flagellar M-ring protein FliF